MGTKARQAAGSLYDFKPEGSIGENKWENPEHVVQTELQTVAHFQLLTNQYWLLTVIKQTYCPSERGRC